MMEHSLPSTPADWLDEIRLALADAEEMAGAGGGTGEPVTDAESLALAMLIAVNFREGKLNGPEAEQAREMAIRNYANLVPENIGEASEQNPILTFAYHYVSAHMALGLLSEEQSVDVLAHCVRELDGD